MFQVYEINKSLRIEKEKEGFEHYFSELSKKTAFRIK